MDQYIQHIINAFNDPTTREEFLADVEGWCRVHGLVMGNGAVAPTTLVPHAIKRQIFEEGIALAPLFGKLVHNISHDHEFIEESLRHVKDEFTVLLLKIMKQVVAEGVRQKTVLGIHRSDYMIHEGERLYQVELNTISSAFAALATRTSALHHYLLSRWSSASPSTINQYLPTPNTALDKVTAAIAKAVEIYGQSSNPIVVMMVVQPEERNSIDQRWLQYQLWEHFQIKLIRRSLSDIAKRGSLDSRGALIIDGYEVAVAYFRAGYTPNDYPSEEQWNGRLLLERSLAIKCPNIFYHLIGAKKIQQVLANKDILRKYLPDPEECDRVFKCFTGLWSLDPGANEDIVKDAIENPSQYVMKPQREGGGNLLSNNEMAQALKTLPPEERANYILMSRINPNHSQTLVYRDGKVTLLNAAVAELGFYTVTVGNDTTLFLNELGGWLVRTKDANVEDGGVASGRAHLDSPVLTD